MTSHVSGIVDSNLSVAANAEISAVEAHKISSVSENRLHMAKQLVTKTRCTTEERTPISILVVVVVVVFESGRFTS